jgi:hypothetical protein
MANVGDLDNVSAVHQNPDEDFMLQDTHEDAKCEMMIAGLHKTIRWMETCSRIFVFFVTNHNER